jgi:hypothetical protein
MKLLGVPLAIGLLSLVPTLAGCSRADAASNEAPAASAVIAAASESSTTAPRWSDKDEARSTKPSRLVDDRPSGQDLWFMRSASGSQPAAASRIRSASNNRGSSSLRSFDRDRC